MDKTITEILSQIQTSLKAPKGQLNKFGGYKYRNCEDILEALKPLLSEHGAIVVITDELVQIGERYYVKATAQLCTNAVGTDAAAISCNAYAREAAEKKLPLIIKGF